MNKLLSVKDIQERYQCGVATARKYIKQMDHMEKPMMVMEKAVMEWERSKMVPSTDRLKQHRRAIK